MKRFYVFTIAVIMILFLSTILSCSNSYPLKGYEWLKGQWFIYQSNGMWGIVAIDDTTYQSINSSYNNSMYDIYKAESLPISIAKITSYTGMDILALNSTDGSVGIDEESKQVFLLVDDTIMYLNKVPKDKNVSYIADVCVIDNNTKFNIVKFKKDVLFRKDYWFSEVGGLVTDNEHWTSGTLYDMGYYTFHRFNMTQYTCLYSDSSVDAKRGEDGYGRNMMYGTAVRDADRCTLPEENGYYILDLRDWEGYVPLYFPYSRDYILDNFRQGDIIFEYVGILPYWN